MKDLLKFKAAKKRKNPSFIRDESFKRKEIGTSWRKPRGQCSKVRKCKFGHPAMPNVGYRTPAALRGMVASGLMPVIVHNVAQISALDKKVHTAIVSGTMGVRKKLAVLDALQTAGVSVVNYDPKKFADEVKKRQDAKKAAAKKTEEKPVKKAAKKKEVKAEEKVEEPAQDDVQKKELDKVLTKRQ